MSTLRYSTSGSASELIPDARTVILDTRGLRYRIKCGPTNPVPPVIRMLCRSPLLLGFIISYRRDISYPSTLMLVAVLNEIVLAANLTKWSSPYGGNERVTFSVPATMGL